MGEGCYQFNLCNILRKRKVIDEKQHAELKIPCRPWGWQGDLWKMKCLKEIACVSWSLGHVFHKCDKTKLRSWGNYCSCLHRWMSSHGISPCSAHFLYRSTFNCLHILALILQIDWKTKNTQTECRTPYIKTRLIINTNKKFWHVYCFSVH